MRTGTLSLSEGVESFRLTLLNEMEDRSVWVKVLSSNKNLISVTGPQAPTGMTLYVVEYSSDLNLNVGLSVDLKAEEVFLNFYAMQTSETNPDRVLAMQEKVNDPQDAHVFKLLIKRQYTPRPEHMNISLYESTSEAQTPPVPMTQSYKYTLQFSADGEHRAKAKAVEEKCGLIEADQSTA
ncbi:hypothetical protein Ddc_12398 [Ditylenchus destructor]|nr:hypothetical protein Ddc_12398 [Ditylenchus destructor]